MKHREPDGLAIGVEVHDRGMTYIEGGTDGDGAADFVFAY